MAFGVSSATMKWLMLSFFVFFFQAEDGIRDWSVTGVQTCALPISRRTTVSVTKIYLSLRQIFVTLTVVRLGLLFLIMRRLCRPVRSEERRGGEGGRRRGGAGD